MTTKEGKRAHLASGAAAEAPLKKKIKAAAAPDQQDDKQPQLHQEKTRKEDRIKQKLQTAERRAKKPLSADIVLLKPLGELIRQKGVATSAKQASIKEALAIIKDSLCELSMKRDASRIIQSIATYCTEEERIEMAKELAGNLLALCQNTFSIHVIVKMARDCGKCRDIFIGAVSGKLPRFLKYKSACKVLDELYQRSNAAKRMRLVSEVYSSEHAITAPAKEIITIQQLIAANPVRRDVILEGMRRVVGSFLGRKMLNFNIIHRIVDDYLAIEYIGKLHEKTEPYLEHIEAMTSSAEGCNAIVRIIAASSAKERKALVKAFKGHVEKLSSDSGQVQILMALLAYVDDTVIVGKAIVGELAKGMELLAASKVGRRLVLQLLAGRVKPYITPQSEAFLTECDALANLTSKKAVDVRRRELYEYAAPAIKKLVTDKFESLTKDVTSMPIAVEYMDLCEDDAECAALLDRALACSAVASEGASLEKEQLSFLRMLAQKSDRLAGLLYAKVAPQLALLLAGQSGFLFVTMLRHESIAEQLRRRLPEIESVASDAARLLVQKLNSSPTATAA